MSFQLSVVVCPGEFFTDAACISSRQYTLIVHVIIFAFFLEPQCSLGVDSLPADPSKTSMPMH